MENNFTEQPGGLLKGAGPVILRVTEEFPGGVRVDKYLSDHLGILSRSQLKQRITAIFINDKSAKPSRRVFPGDTVCLEYTPPPDHDLTPENIPLDIIFENPDVVVVNKAPGLVVHPATGHWSGTLVNALLFHCENLKRDFPDREIRPGIVHRLDKDTSGIIITAKNVAAQEFLARQFRESETVKNYLAVAKGMPPLQEGCIGLNVKRDPHNRKRFIAADTGGKTAETHYKLQKTFDGYSFMLLIPKTGRTHQLRVHLKHIGCPILGDPVYSRKDKHHPDAGLMLHAYRLTILLPGETEPRTFEAPLPEGFRKFFTDQGYKADKFM